MVIKIEGITECPRYDTFWGVDERHDHFLMRLFDPMVNFDPYTGERKE